MALIADELRGLMSLMTLGAGDRAKVRVVVIDIAAGCLLSKLFIASAMTLEAVLRRDVFGAGRSRIVTGPLSVKITFATLSVLHGVVKHAIFAGVYR